MICLNCGNEVRDGVKLCPHCGSLLESGDAPSAPEANAPRQWSDPGDSGAQWSAPSDSSAQWSDSGDSGAQWSNSGDSGAQWSDSGSNAQWSDPGQGRKKHRGIWLIAGGAVAIVLVVVLAVMAVSHLFSSPKGQVEQALTKTLDAYAGVKDTVALPDLAALLQGQSYSQSFSVTLNSISQELTGWYDMSGLKGIGVRADMDYDQASQKMNFDMSAFWDNESLMSLQMQMDGSKVLFSSPEFTMGDVYGLDTKTIGEDLARLGVLDDPALENIGFNFFELMGLMIPSQSQSGEMKQAMDDAYQELSDSVEVEQVGKETIEVNGKSVNATHYHVVVPKSAMKDYVKALESAMTMVDYQAMMENMLLAIGLDKSMVRQSMSGMGGVDIYGQAFDALKEAISAIGDVELEVYLNGGYLTAVEYSNRIEGTKVAIGLYLGGGSNYVDDLSLEISINGEKLTIESTGDHSAKSGTFTDETTIRAGSDRLTSELSYKPGGAFEWEIKVNGTASVAMEGQLTTTKDSIDLQMDEFAVKMAGTKLLSLEIAYYLGPYQGPPVSMSSPRMLSSMDLNDLRDLRYEIVNNVETWVDDLDYRIMSILYGY